MSRSAHSRRKDHHDQVFPIRVRVKVPEGGFGRKLDELYAWLDDMAGKGNYAIHPGNLPGVQAIVILLEEPELVRVMIEALELELAGIKLDPLL